jgi:hypothetical protein
MGWVAFRIRPGCPRSLAKLDGSCESIAGQYADGRVQTHWSSAYDGYGTGNLDRDRDEMGVLVKVLRERGELLY